MTTLPRIEFVPLTYIEDDSFRSVGDPEPYVRRQDVIFCSQSLRWRVKVTFNSAALKQFPKDGSENLCRFLNKPIKNNLERRQEFQSFFRPIKFESLALLDNTVTEIELRLEPTENIVSNVYSKQLLLGGNVQVAQENRFLDIAHRLTWTMREDPARILYPPYVHDPS